MKRFALFFSMILLVALAVTAYAGTGKQITASRTFTPSSQAKVTGTKVTVATTIVSAIRTLCTADCYYKLNGTGDAFLVKANTPDTIYLPQGVGFVSYSAAAATSFYTQKQ